MSRSDVIARAVLGHKDFDPWGNGSLPLVTLLFWLAVPLSAEAPVLPAAPFPAQRFVVLETGFEALWAAADKAASASQRRIVLREKSLGVITFSEYLAPQLQQGSFRNLAIFIGSLRRSEDDLSQFLTSRLSEEIRKELAAYDPKQYPSDELVRRVTEELNRLLFTEVIERAPSVDAVSKPADSANGDDRAVWNRQALESAYPDQIIRGALSRPRSESTLFITLYLHAISSRRTAVFVSMWLQGSPAMGSRDRQLLAEIESALDEKGE